MGEVSPVAGVAIKEFVRHFLHVDPDYVAQITIDTGEVIIEEFLRDVDTGEILVCGDFAATSTTRLPIQW